MENEKRTGAEKNIYREIKEWAAVIIIGLAAVLIIRNFGFRITAVKRMSMEPNYVNGEYVFTDMLSYKLGSPENNDIVICEYNGGAERQNFIKRVIGCPGDEINIYYDNDEECYKTEVNGVTLDEYYLNEPMYTCGDWDYPITLGENEYFVMGDNRNVSADSRDEYVGLFEKQDIVGKVRFKIVDRTK